MYRYQYLTLATFLARGLCPELHGADESRQQEYLNLYHRHPEHRSWGSFFRESSRCLNTAVSVEVCFCDDGDAVKGTLPETRSYVYKDHQVRESNAVGAV